MAEKCRLSVNLTGAFLHPLGDQTPIDCRYGETIETVQLSDHDLVLVTGRQWVGYGRVTSPRAVTITNVSNQGAQSMPPADELERMRQRVLLIGFGDNTEPSLALPPMVPGGSPFGCGQLLWLCRGATVWLDVPAGMTAQAKIQAFPGAS